MKIKNDLLCTFVICLLPFSAHANINIENHTTVDATAFSDFFGQCSSKMGEKKGIIKANGFMPIKQSLVTTFCVKQACDAQIHMSRDCTGDLISTALIKATEEGVVDITIKNTNMNGYVLRKVNDNTVAIEDGRQKSLFRYLLGYL